MLGYDGCFPLFCFITSNEAVSDCDLTIALLRNKLVFSEKRNDYITHCSPVVLPETVHGAVNR